MNQVKQRKILIVDDEQLIRWSLVERLVQEGHRVLEAETGREALEKIAGRSYDLIVSDLRMPELDGLAVCRLLRQDPGLAGSRIVMLTAASQEADRVRGLAAGADGYLTKPFSPLALFSLVRSLLPEAVSWPDM